MSQALIGPELTRAYTTADITEGRAFALLETQESFGNGYMFVVASVAITQYDCVAIKSNGHAIPMTEAASKTPIKIGFGQVALSIGQYGWVQTSGRPTIRVAASCAADIALYVTATAGVLDDATVSQMIQGVVAGSAGTAGGVAAVGAVAENMSVRRLITL